MCICECRCLQWPEESDPPGSGVPGSCAGRKTQGSLEKQYMLLTTEQSLQTQESWQQLGPYEVWGKSWFKDKEEKDPSLLVQDLCGGFRFARSRISGRQCQGNYWKLTKARSSYPEPPMIFSSVN